MLNYFESVPEHFDTLCIKGLKITDLKVKIETNSTWNQMDCHIKWISLRVSFYADFKTLIKTTFYTAQKIKFSMKDFFSKCDETRMKLRIWSDLLKKPLIENFIFCTVLVKNLNVLHLYTTSASAGIFIECVVT